jgi:HK97 family phage portal protein
VSILRSLFERRASLESPLTNLDASTLNALLAGDTMTSTGIAVNEHSAMRHSGVWRSVNLLAGTMAGLPLHAYKTGTREKVSSRILDSPHPSLTPYEFWERVMVSLLLWGNAYCLKQRNAAGQLQSLEPLMPEWVKVGRFKRDGYTETLLPSRKVFKVTIPGEAEQTFTELEIFHIPGIGYDGICGLSPIRAARQSIALGLAAEEYGAQLWAKGSLMSGILQTEQRLKPEEAEGLKTRWMAKIAGLGKAHEIAVLDAGAKFQPIGINPDDAQFLETRRFQITEQGRWFGIPPHMLYETEKSTTWGSGIESIGQGFVTYSLSTWTNRIEQRVTKDVLLNPKQYAKYSVQGLLRGDSAARSAFYASAIQNGWMNVDEVRELEDRPPLPDDAGQTYLTPLNLAPAGGDPNATKPDPADNPD